MGDIDAISHTIGRMESKLDHLVSSHEAFTERFEKHDERLKEIEGYKNYLLGLAAAVAIIFSVVADFVKSRIFGGA
jgi:hypothetical protein